MSWACVADTTTEPAPIIDTLPVFVIVTTPEDKVEKVNEAVLLEARDIRKIWICEKFCNVRC